MAAVSVWLHHSRTVNTVLQTATHLCLSWQSACRNLPNKQNNSRFHCCDRPQVIISSCFGYYFFFEWVTEKSITESFILGHEKSLEKNACSGDSTFLLFTLIHFLYIVLITVQWYLTKLMPVFIQHQVVMLNKKLCV